MHPDELGMPPQSAMRAKLQVDCKGLACMTAIWLAVEMQAGRRDALRTYLSQQHPWLQAPHTVRAAPNRFSMGVKQHNNSNNNTDWPSAC